MVARSILLVAALSLLAPQARAQSAAPDTLPPPTPQKSVAAAHLLSAGGLLVPVAAGGLLAAHSGGSSQGGSGAALIYAGLMVGPSVGYFYGGCTKRAWIGIGIRAGITAAALTVAAVTPPTGGFDVDYLIGGVALGLIAVEGIY